MFCLLLALPSKYMYIIYISFSETQEKDIRRDIHDTLNKQHHYDKTPQSEKLNIIHATWVLLKHIKSDFGQRV